MAREWTLLKNPRNCLERQVILKGEWWKFVSQRLRKRQYSIGQTATTGKTLYDLPRGNQLRRRLFVRWVSSQTTENLLACHRNHDYRGNWTFHGLTCITSGTIRTSASEYKIPLTNWRQFFYASVLLLIMNFVITLSKKLWIQEAIAEWICACRPRLSRLAASPLDARRSLVRVANWRKKKRDCSQSIARSN